MTHDLNNLGKVIDTDVLVLGSGAAGCGAAMGAREQGARVLLIDKGKLDSSGALGGGNDHFMANLNSGPEWDTDQAVLNNLKGIRYPKSNIVLEGWIKKMPLIMNRLKSMGIEFVKNPDGSYLRTIGFGQPGPWWINISNGQNVKRRIASWIRNMGIDVIDHIMITKLFTYDRKVVGAAGFNILDGNYYIFRSKCVVMALGNTVARVTTNSTGNAFNCHAYPFNTGSQCMMAYDAGAKIYNLDISQNATILPKGFGAAGMNALNSMGGHELNAFGERFMGKYDPKWENGGNILQIQGTFQEYLEGHGPPFYMDMTHFSESEIHLLKDVLLTGDKATYKDYLEAVGLDLAKNLMEVELGEISFGGMIQINDKYESNLSGLFIGCIFGFFSGAICGGYSAGIEAGKAAIKKTLSDIDTKQLTDEKEHILSPMKIQKGFTPEEFEDLVRQVMNYYMGFSRNQKGMELAQQKLEKIERHMNDVKAINYHELMRANEAKTLLRHCQLTIKAVLERKESGRSIYRRSDYPKLDIDMAKWIVLWQENGKPKMDIVSSAG